MSDSAVRDTFSKWLDVEGDQIIKENISKLVLLDEFQIGGKTYKRKMLKPKDIFDLQKLDKEQLENQNDSDLQLEILKKQSKICLADMSDVDFDNTDGVMLQNVIVACRVIAKGFRKL